MITTLMKCFGVCVQSDPKYKSKFEVFKFKYFTS